uniref:DNA-directed RNA polymerase II subunit G n=1 Tax=Tetraselmis sp. GSL018 TaxID=582737 RepID=A0A061S9A0_9CHLO|mmetsp:Transcript_43033/g.102165  ORF Transcript_43033/g.102165 Transcript_43033/m.102165 type:complete len:175 (-) Transcript_43033:2169-2693(-)
MFFYLALDREVELHPQFFGPRLRQTLEEKLKQTVEGTCSSKYGFIICVTQLHSVGKGVILEGSGFARFKVNYGCIVFRPFKNEVADALVTAVTNMGFFASIGPLNVFVSSHCIPDDFEYSSHGEQFVSEDEMVQIEKGCEVRLRITGAKYQNNTIFCIGTINDNYLGVLKSTVA